MESGCDEHLASTFFDGFFGGRFSREFVMNARHSFALPAMALWALLWSGSVTGTRAQITWARTYGGSGTDLLHTLAQL